MFRLLAAFFLRDMILVISVAVFAHGKIFPRIGQHFPADGLVLAAFPDFKNALRLEVP